MDVHKTRINCLTAGHPTGAMLPLDYESDQELLTAALATIGLTEPVDAKLMWIKNTLELAELECSTAYWEAAQLRDDLEVMHPPGPMSIDADGNLVGTRH